VSTINYAAQRVWGARAPQRPAASGSGAARAAERRGSNAAQSIQQEAPRDLS